MRDTTTQLFATERPTSADSLHAAGSPAFAMVPHPTSMACCSNLSGGLNLYALAYEAARRTVREAEIRAWNRFLPSSN